MIYTTKKVSTYYLPTLKKKVVAHWQNTRMSATSTVGKKVEIDRQRLFVVKHGAMKWVLGVNILCKFDCGVSSIVALGKISDYHKEAKVVCQYIGVFIM